jgi:hypothetical protein
MNRQCVKWCNKLICVDCRKFWCFSHQCWACHVSSCNLTAGYSKVFMPLRYRVCGVRVLTVICPEYILRLWCTLGAFKSEHSLSCFYACRHWYFNFCLLSKNWNIPDVKLEVLR